jgi:hypothetical protein
MADLKHVKTNRITEELDREVTGKRKLVLVFGLPVALVLLLVNPSLGIMAVLGVAVGWFMAGGKDAAKLSGAAGEDYTLQVLASLPATYTVFNQVELPDEKSRTGWRELDFIVCGPNGIFVVESKNHRGDLSGSEDDDTWTVHKVGRRGTAYASSVRNPVRQVKSQVAVLRKYLARQKLHPWIEPIISLSSNNDTSQLQVRSLAVVGSASLAAHIQRHQDRGPVKDLMAVIAALRELEVRKAA